MLSAPHSKGLRTRIYSFEENAIRRLVYQHKMNVSDRATKKAWYRRRSGLYEIKERPKSWHVSEDGNYRQIEAIINKAMQAPQEANQRSTVPPAPPIRSSTTRLQTTQSVDKTMEDSTSTGNKLGGRLNEHDNLKDYNGEVQQNANDNMLSTSSPEYGYEEKSTVSGKKRIQPIITL